MQHRHSTWLYWPRAPQLKPPGCSGRSGGWHGCVFLSSLDSLSKEAMVLRAAGRPNPGCVSISFPSFDFYSVSVLVSRRISRSDINFSTGITK